MHLKHLHEIKWTLRTSATWKINQRTGPPGMTSFPSRVITALPPCGVSTLSKPFHRCSHLNLTMGKDVWVPEPHYILCKTELIDGLTVAGFEVQVQASDFDLPYDTH